MRRRHRVWVCTRQPTNPTPSQPSQPRADPRGQRQGATNDLYGHRVVLHRVDSDHHQPITATGGPLRTRGTIRRCRADATAICRCVPRCGAGGAARCLGGHRSRPRSRSRSRRRRAKPGRSRRGSRVPRPAGRRGGQHPSADARHGLRRRDGGDGQRRVIEDRQSCLSGALSAIAKRANRSDSPVSARS
jgi:hypothetical protein